MSEIHCDIPFEVSVLIPSGRKMNINFRKEIQSLSLVDSLLDELPKGDGCILVVEYKGSGCFLMNIFDREGSEIEYCIPEQPTWEHVCYQGLFYFNILP